MRELELDDFCPGRRVASHSEGEHQREAKCVGTKHGLFLRVTALPEKARPARKRRFFGAIRHLRDKAVAIGRQIVATPSDVLIRADQRKPSAISVAQARSPGDSVFNGTLRFAAVLTNMSPLLGSPSVTSSVKPSPK